LSSWILGFEFRVLGKSRLTRAMKNNFGELYAMSNIDYKSIHEDIERLMIETFGLWDENRVGFRWRNYILNHTSRVHSMCVELGKIEGANLTELQFAGTLHDITKLYDGVYLTDENGKRVVDENGFWRNELLMPARNNIVTQIYDENELYGTIHHISGAFVARKILERYGLDREFIDNVCSIIKAHVKPLNLNSEELAKAYEKIEHRIISDADTMDANVGYVAFFRNIHIHAPRAIQSGGFNMENYIDSMGRWIEMKQPFADNLFTESARKIAEERQTRKRLLHKELVEEKENFDLNMKFGMIGVIDYFVSQTEDPDFGDQISYIQDNWIPERQKLLEQDGNLGNHEIAKQSLSRVIDFCKDIYEEAQGKK